MRKKLWKNIIHNLFFAQKQEGKKDVKNILSNRCDWVSLPSKNKQNEKKLKYIHSVQIKIHF